MAKRQPPKPETDRGSGNDIGLDRHWHLAGDEHEIAVSEMEYSLMRCFEAFGHWEAECFAAVSGLQQMNGSDTAILHVIRMKERPKGIKEIGRLMNRDDIPNLQYSIRKLLKAGLVEKCAHSSHRQGVTYQATQHGREVTEAYARLRSRLLMDFTRSVSNFEEALVRSSRTLDLLSGMYEQAARIAATHRK